MYVHIIIKIKAVLFHAIKHDPKRQDTRDHSEWTIGNGDPMNGVCISHGIPRAWKP